ncbi:helix-turn-helix domain-containing protein [Methylobacterium flocculans]|uniref:helix-turn-helix domain-containing protein n=1 Tax=Methylobacterium flocculans TaxID=2984843 RepID=UPI0021F3566A|nr:helix-turn-helix domain-containing protein [Methylobacterium sp. FF17]
MNPIAQQPLALLAEADALVGIDLSDALQQAGYRVLGPFATTPEALAAVERTPPTVAVVDVVLRDGVCTALESTLRRRGIPFVVHAGVLPAAAEAHGFQGVPWLGKPAQPQEVVALLDELSGPASPVVAKAAAPILLTPAVEARRNPLVRKLEGFGALSEADRAVLTQISANPRLIGPRMDLIREGDRPEGVFLVLDGMACRHKVRETGARQILAYLLPGDLCDLDVALLDTMDHTITTVSACRVVQIPPETIAALIQHHPQVARALRKAALVDNATLREWLVNVGSRSAVERLAHLFCELLVRLRAVDRTEGDSFELPVTQAELGDTTGLSNVHVNRSLQELRRQGLIELKGRRLTILNLPRLRAVAEFRSNYLHLGNRTAA